MKARRGGGGCEARPDWSFSPGTGRAGTGEEKRDRGQPKKTEASRGEDKTEKMDGGTERQQAEEGDRESADEGRRPRGRREKRRGLAAPSGRRTSRELRGRQRTVEEICKNVDGDGDAGDLFIQGQRERRVWSG